MKALRLTSFLIVAIVGCTSKSTITIIPAKSRPYVDFTQQARDGLQVIADKQQLGTDWWVRLDVAWKPDAQIEVNIERTPPGPGDYVIDLDGLRCVMAKDQKVYLKGARVDLFWVKSGAGFDVTFPHRDERDRELASKWLKDERAKRKIASP